MKRALIYAHWDIHGLVDDHVLYSLEQYRPWVSMLVFVSSNYKRRCRKLEKICDKVISRKNEGWDYGSWKAGLAILKLGQYEEVIFTNDSVYGPFQPLKNLFTQTKIVSKDIWGITISMEHHVRHLQSYFFAMKKRVLLSPVGKNFWGDVAAVKNQRELIERFEMRNLKEFEGEGFQAAALFDGSKNPELPWSEKLANLLRGPKRFGQSRTYLKACGFKPYNPTHLQWRQCVEAGVPFLKVDLFRDNPNHLRLGPVRRWIAANTDYPADLIHRHLSRLRRCTMLGNRATVA